MKIHNFVKEQLKVTKHGQHQLNENFVSHETKHQYINIPKNSSSWTKIKLRHAKFIKCNYLIPEYTKIIILRDEYNQPTINFLNELTLFNEYQDKLAVLLNT